MNIKAQQTAALPTPCGDVADDGTPIYHLGIDVGSKTVKFIIQDEAGEIVYSLYRRHHSDVRTTMLTAFHDALWMFGDVRVRGGITGSAGMRLAEMLDLPFTQEVVATKRAVEQYIPQTDVAIELGGEDAKIIYFTGGVDQRMNATCAGGTGGFLDLMASMLGVRTSELDRLAGGYQTIYPIASRCAVFAQMDVRPLLNEGARKADIAASALQAVVTQTISGLACGRPIRGNVAFLGGPLQHMNMLVFFFTRALKLTSSQAIRPRDAHLFVARGAALGAERGRETTLGALEALLESLEMAHQEGVGHLPPLFSDDAERIAFKERHAHAAVPRADIHQYEGDIYLGIDAGSTTVKLVAVSNTGTLLYSDYQRGGGKLLEKIVRMLDDFYGAIPHLYGGKALAHVRRACVTGYGEDMLKAVLGADMGEVETVAHLRAAYELMPAVDFVLDIGGQDIKCMKVRDGVIEDIMLNEACSSGCGALIEGFARSLGCTKWSFAAAALEAADPIDLGTRCTVFMTSRVRHAQKEGIPVSDIAAGLAYSVVRNALYKVIGLVNPEQLGENIIVQGGAFMSDAVLRAFECISGREVVRPDIANLMGAYGAALLARDAGAGMDAGADAPATSTLISRAELKSIKPTHRTRRCQACTNACLLTVSEFGTDAQGRKRRFVSGNRCERAFGEAVTLRDIPNLFAFEQDLLESYAPRDVGRVEGDDEAHTFVFPTATEEEEDDEATFTSASLRTAGLVIGIPRVLELYESFPFWYTLFTELGCAVISPTPTDMDLYRKGAAAVLSESVCFPAKVAHGHVVELVERGVDAVFMPKLPSAFATSAAPVDASISCQVSSGYAEVVESSLRAIMDELPPFIMSDMRESDPVRDPQGVAMILQVDFARAGFAFSQERIMDALQVALGEQRAFESRLQAEGDRALRLLQETGGHGIVLACHPYHVDAGLNHGIDLLLNRLGFAVFSERSIAHLDDSRTMWADGVEPVAAHWIQPARLYRAARIACAYPTLDLVQMYSFGCGIDALSTGQMRTLVEGAGKVYTALKVDEMVDLATVRIRLRSLAAALVQRGGRSGVRADDAADSSCGLIASGAPGGVIGDGLYRLPDSSCGQTGLDLLSQTDNTSLVVCPHIAPVHLQAVCDVLAREGHRFEVLGEPTLQMIETGLRHLDNDLCYPMIALAGQLIERLGELSAKRSLAGVSVFAPQLCVGCRAVEFGAVLRQAFDAVGFEQVGVIAFPGSQHITMLSPALHCKLGQALEQADSIVAARGLNGVSDVDSGDEVSPPPLPSEPFPRVSGAGKVGMAVPLGEIESCGFPTSAAGSGGETPSSAEGVFGQMLSKRIEGARDDSLRPRIGIVGAVPLTFTPTLNKNVVALIRQAGCEPVLPAITGILLSQAPLEFALKGFAEQGISHVVCIQAFGCMSGHIHGRGAVHRIRERYPDMRITFIDYDPGTSETNQLNRIVLALAVALDELKE